MIAERGRRKVPLAQLAPCHGWRRAAWRRGDRDAVSRARMDKLNAATYAGRMMAWAVRMLRAGVKPAEVTKLTGIEIKPKQEASDAERT